MGVFLVFCICLFVGASKPHNLIEHSRQKWVGRSSEDKQVEKNQSLGSSGSWSRSLPGTGVEVILSRSLIGGLVILPSHLSSGDIKVYHCLWQKSTSWTFCLWQKVPHPGAPQTCIISTWVTFRLHLLAVNTQQACQSYQLWDWPFVDTFLLFFFFLSYPQGSWTTVALDSPSTRHAFQLIVAFARLEGKKIWSKYETTTTTTTTTMNLTCARFSPSPAVEQ